MVKYIGSKLLWAIVKVTATTTIVFALLHFADFAPLSIIAGG